MNADLLVQILPYFVAVVAPLLVARQLNKARRVDKQQDWDREDKVAEKVAAVAARAAEAQRSTDAKLTALKDVADITHALVNSNYTAALENELAGLNRELVLLSVAPASAETTRATETAKTRIANLEKVLAERAEQQRQAEAATGVAPATALVEAADELKVAADKLKHAKDHDPPPP